MGLPAAMDVSIRALLAGESAICERILRALPDWFGIESSLVSYANDTERMPTWLAVRGDEIAGFVTVRRHFPRAAEIHCMAVLPQHHRSGIGRRLVSFVAARCLDEGVEYLQVKTVGPSRPDPFYERTRRFYQAVGFTPLEEIHGLWPGNPCLLLVRKLGGD